MSKLRLIDRVVLLVQVMIKGPPDLQQFGCENKRGTAALASFDMASPASIRRSRCASTVHPMSFVGGRIGFSFHKHLQMFHQFLVFHPLEWLPRTAFVGLFQQVFQRRNPLMPGETWVPGSHHQMSNLCESTQGQALRLAHIFLVWRNRLQNPTQQIVGQLLRMIKSYL